MPSIRVSKELNSGTYFFTVTVRYWYYVLDRYNRWDIITNSLKFFQKNRGLKIYGFALMINHIHLIIFSDNVISFICDFKKFTAREILKNIKQFEPDILKLFIKKNGICEFWSKTNMPEIIESENFLLQKMNYIHENPVKRDYVLNPEDWYWSSANPLCELKADNLPE